MQAPVAEQRTLLEMQGHDSAIDRLLHRRGSLPEDARLAELLAAVRASAGEERDRARSLMLEVFRLLGDDHPLTVRYRRDLTLALF